MVKDEARWQQNDDGSWSRRIGDMTPAQPDATQGAVDAAAELGVDLASLTGTGKGGKIIKSDVEAAANT
jgi:pyruvate/2-oxoglutarate dehydrogenase complex dihydrolipoamide acyltransferase (E2) component